MYKRIWSKKHSLRLGENWSYGPLQFEEIFGVKFPNQFIGYKGGFAEGYVDDEMLETCHQHAVKKIYEKGFTGYFESQALPVFTEFLEFSKGLAAAGFTAYSDAALHELWRSFVEKEDKWMNYVWMVFLLDEGLTNEMKCKLGELHIKDKDRFLPAMVAPSQKTAAYFQKVDLLNIARKMKQGENADSLFKEIAEKYAYFSILNMDESPLSARYFKGEVETFMQGDPEGELKKLASDDEALDVLYKEVQEMFSGNPEMFKLAEASRKVAYYREYRNDLRQESYFYARHLYQEIAQRSEIGLSDVIFATRKEIDSFLLGGEKIAKERIKERRGGYAAIISDYNQNTVSYLFGDEAKIAYPKDVLNSNQKEFGGTVAYKGKVSGIVRIISDVAEQGGNVREGDILVATTTNLTFIPLMGKVAAIVVDQGGMLTHAAIVSREFKKPCIVGTKFATQVLHDGDLVEVDADNGVVKIIEKANTTLN